MNKYEKIEHQRKGFNHHTIYVDIIINAPVKMVWKTLMDFESYKNWAQFFIGMEGEIKDKGKVVALFQQKPDAKPMKVKHTIFYQEGEHFGWSESIIPGVKDNHWFIVEDLGNEKTRFIQSDEFKGMLTWLMAGYLKDSVLKGYPAFNRSLKAEVERRFK